MEPKWVSFNAYGIAGTDEAKTHPYRRIEPLTESKATNVNPRLLKETTINALTEYALENMTSFYSVIRKDFSIQCNTTDCYRPLHLYKCRHARSHYDYHLPLDPSNFFFYSPHTNRIPKFSTLLNFKSDLSASLYLGYPF